MSVLPSEMNESFRIQEKPFCGTGPGFTGGFSLRLANGQGWNILFTEETRSLVERWASIMEIKENGTHGYPQMLFLRREENGQKGEEKKEWEVQNLERMRIWSHRSLPHRICEIGAEDHFDLDLIRMWTATYPIYQRAVEAGGLPFHACLAGRGGGSYWPPPEEGENRPARDVFPLPGRFCAMMRP